MAVGYQPALEGAYRRETAPAAVGCRRLRRRGTPRLSNLQKRVHVSTKSAVLVHRHSAPNRGSENIPVITKRRSHAAGHHEDGSRKPKRFRPCPVKLHAILCVISPRLRRHSERLYASI
jgi:hypothetical protein